MLAFLALLQHKIVRINSLKPDLKLLLNHLCFLIPGMVIRSSGLWSSIFVNRPTDQIELMYRIIEKQAEIQHNLNKEVLRVISENESYMYSL